MPVTEKPVLPQLRANNRYLLEWMKRESRPGARALDYGCGDGALVFTAREAGIDAYGAETFYDGARPQDLELIRQFDPQTSYVSTIVGNKLSYPDGFFDLVVANQVFEHIHDLSGTAAELFRVLKPGGMLLSIFPLRGVIREAHLRVPLIHHFPKGKFRRVYYKVARSLNPRARRIDWGEGEAGVDKAFWFLDNHTCYRNLGQIRGIFDPLFDLRFIEPNWLAYRLPRLAKLKAIPGARLAARIFTHLGAGTVLLGRKR